MKYKAPGKSFREGLSTAQFFKIFPDDNAAEEWFIKQFWPDEMCCPHCGSVNVQTGAKHKTMPFRCRDCRRRFSTKIGTFMEGSKIGYQDWLYAFYLFCTNLKSVSSMKLHRELGISQKSAWFMAHRLRQAWNTWPEKSMEGPVETDTTHMGGKRKNMPKRKRSVLTGRGAVGKTAVTGIKDRRTNEVRAKVVPDSKGDTLRGFVTENIQPDAKVYTDDAPVYDALPNRESVNHSHMEYVKGDVHTNGIESFWSMLKRAHVGTFHKLSKDHLHRYVGEFAGRHNMRSKGTLDQMSEIANRGVGKRLKYRVLVG